MPTVNQSLVDALKIRLGEPRKTPVEDLNFGLSDGTASQTFNLPYTDSIDTTNIKVAVGQEYWTVVNTYAGVKEKLDITFTGSTQVATVDELVLTFTAGSPTAAGTFTVDLLDNAVSIVGGAQVVTAIGLEDATAIATTAFAVLNPLVPVAYTLTDNLDGTLTLVRVETGPVNTLSSAFVDTDTTGVALGDTFTDGIAEGDITIDILNNGTTVITGPVTVTIPVGATAAGVATLVHAAITTSVDFVKTVNSEVVSIEAVEPGVNLLTTVLVDTDTTGVTETNERTEGIDRTDILAYGASDKVVQVDETTGVVTFGDGTNGAIPASNTPVYATFYDLRTLFTDQQYDNLVVEAYKDVYLCVDIAASYDSTTNQIDVKDNIREEALILCFAEFATYKASFHIDEFYFFKQQDLTVDTTKSGRLAVDYMEKVLCKAKSKAVKAFKKKQMAYYPVLTSGADLIGDLYREI